MVYMCVAACNRTYYGDVGKTYDLELHRPKEDKVPYICRLTFSAPGGELGDIVQVTAYLHTLIIYICINELYFKKAIIEDW